MLNDPTIKCRLRIIIIAPRSPRKSDYYQFIENNKELLSAFQYEGINERATIYLDGASTNSEIVVKAIIGKYAILRMKQKGISIDRLVPVDRIYRQFIHLANDRQLIWALLITEMWVDSKELNLLDKKTIEKHTINRLNSSWIKQLPTEYYDSNNVVHQNVLNWAIAYSALVPDGSKYDDFSKRYLSLLKDESIDLNKFKPAFENVGLLQNNNIRNPLITIESDLLIANFLRDEKFKNRFVYNDFYHDEKIQDMIRRICYIDSNIIFSLVNVMTSEDILSIIKNRNCTSFASTLLYITGFQCTDDAKTISARTEIELFLKKLCCNDDDSTTDTTIEIEGDYIDCKSGYFPYYVQATVNNYPLNYSDNAGTLLKTLLDNPSLLDISLIDYKFLLEQYTRFLYYVASHKKNYDTITNALSDVEKYIKNSDFDVSTHLGIAARYAKLLFLKTHNEFSHNEFLRDPLWTNNHFIQQIHSCFNLLEGMPIDVAISYAKALFNCVLYSENAEKSKTFIKELVQLNQVHSSSLITKQLCYSLLNELRFHKEENNYNNLVNDTKKSIHNYCIHYTEYYTDNDFVTMFDTIPYDGKPVDTTEYTKTNVPVQYKE